MTEPDTVPDCPSLTRVQCIDDPVEFIKAVRGDDLNVAGVEDHYMYRGVGDSSYSLIPTSLRTDLTSTKRFHELSDLIRMVTPGAKDSAHLQHMREFTILNFFCQVAAHYGTQVPSIVTPWIHEALYLAAADNPGEREDGTFWQYRLGEWPWPEILPLSAAAQHYGLPTRMLDWTYDPTIGIYFAAAAGLRRLEQNNEGSTKIAVWRANIRSINSIAKHARHAGSESTIHVYRPPLHDPCRARHPLNIDGDPRNVLGY